MADREDSSSSSDESIICDVQTLNEGLKPYQFEPKRTSTDSSSDSSADSASSDTEDETRATSTGRTENTDWCNCGNCSVEFLEQDRECLCCKERQATRALASGSNDDDTICIINHPDFQLLCLSPAVLRNVLVALNNIRADNWEVNPPNNRNFRYAAYRQITWWVHGKLGSGHRRIIPACATNAIRMRFPAAPGENYTAFSSGEESDTE